MRCNMFMPFKNRIVLRIDMYPRSLRQIIKIKNVNSMKGYFKMDIKTAEQQTNIQQYGDWYTGR